MESPVSPAALIRAFAVAVVVSGAFPPAVTSQSSATLNGRVMHRRNGAASEPLARQWTYLVEFRGDSSRPLDSVQTDDAGRYRLSVIRADTAARYVVATAYSDVDYFSQPLVLTSGIRLSVDPIVVYDTTASGPAMRLERRLVAVFRATAPSGGRMQIGVQEMVEVVNPGERTRIATDTTNPVWAMRLPEGVGNWTFAAGDVTSEAVWFDDHTLKVFAPIWPGAPLRASYRYTLGSRELRVPVDQWTGELNLLVEDTSAELGGVALQSLGTHELEGRRFVAYRAGPLEAGAEIRVTLPRGPVTPEDLLPYVIAGAALALAAGLWFALRRRPATTGGGTSRRTGRPVR